MAVSFAEAVVIGAVVFGLGISLGMLLYRVLWHVDTGALRAEIASLKTLNRGLYDEISRLGQEVSTLRGRLVELESSANHYRDEFQALLRRG